MAVLVAVDERARWHDTGPNHPERPARFDAVLAGIAEAGLDPARARLDPRAASRDELERVHPPEYLDRIEAICAAGGGRLDPDTVAGRASWDAARYAAGAGLAAIDALRDGRGDAAFLAVRPPGHHAVPARSMGFCLVNNLAVGAAALVAAGERVLVIDWDAHHGNGTQDIFWNEPDVFYVSLHQSPLYPGTGAAAETGGPGAVGRNLNLPLPPGATGDVYRDAFENVIAPAAAGFDPDWVLVSAGFDAHRDDPLTDLGLSAGDFVDLTNAVVALAPAGRVIAYLEGGYDLDALRHSVRATMTTLAGEAERPEPATAGGPGRAEVAAAARRWASGG